MLHKLHVTLGAVLSKQPPEVSCDHPCHGERVVNTRVWVSKKLSVCQAAVDILGQRGCEVPEAAHPSVQQILAWPASWCSQDEQHQVFTYYLSSQEIMHENKHRKLHLKCQNMFLKPHVSNTFLS